MPWCLVAGTALLAVSSASAQAEWDWRFDPYLWGSAIDGNLALGPLEQQVDVSFSDIVDMLAGAALLHVEATKEGRGFFGDLVWLSVEPEGHDTVGGPTSTQLDTLIVELGYVRPYDRFALELGARYWDFELELEPALLPALAGHSDWVDGFVGIRRAGAIGEHWSSSLRFNVGTGGTDLTYGMQFEFARTLEHDNALLIGFKVLGIEREDSSAGGAPLNVDMIIEGVTIGFRFD